MTKQVNTIIIKNKKAYIRKEIQNLLIEFRQLKQEVSVGAAQHEMFLNYREIAKKLFFSNYTKGGLSYALRKQKKDYKFLEKILLKSSQNDTEEIELSEMLEKNKANIKAWCIPANTNKAILVLRKCVEQQREEK